MVYQEMKAKLSEIIVKLKLSAASPYKCNGQMTMEQWDAAIMGNDEP